MHPGRPSLTAMYVAFARAVATHEPTLSRVCHDPFAERLLPRGVGTFLEANREGEAAGLVLRGVRAASFGMIDHLALRTRIIDDAVRGAIAGGARQLVLLGAGLDARAHRMEELRETVVFEVDHPNTQTLKRKSAARLPQAAAEVRYAACDFETVALEDALAGMGFASDAPSVWIWEGVTMYLEPAAVRASLDTIASLSVAGSTLIATYVTPRITLQGPAFGAIGARILSAAAEPLRTTLEPEALSSLLAERHYEVCSDVLPLDACARYACERPTLPWAVPAERVVVAQKRGGTAAHPRKKESES